MSFVETLLKCQIKNKEKEMNTLIIVLIVVVIFSYATDLFISLRNDHFNKQYDLLCRQLRESTEERKSSEKHLMKIIQDHKDYIRQLEDTVNKLTAGVTYRIKRQDGTVEVAEQVKNENMENDGKQA